MATKRSPVDAHLQSARSPRSGAKRSKLSPSRQVDPLAPEIVVDGSDNEASMRSIEHDGRRTRRDGSASGNTCTFGDEADAEHEEDDSDSEYITTVRVSARYPSTYVKPEIDPDVVMAYAKELESKLHAFLPKLRQANQKLAEQSTKLNMEHVNEGEQHIEMSLNLGILEQKHSVDKAATEEICLPNRKSDGPEELLQLTEENVNSLLNGKRGQARPSIELLDTADVVETLPRRSKAVNS
ncbi:hypothetical protein CERZMDRAFT_81412 [Cercospora zeae-maydis SCOH1-5]|uniref:Uncharacterized protein n=1 Tax=Cercospora zeae-maydis SCOH1-5 TaxID=717836 RepID=A0A6A6FS45_9PEZI|nr:hypothetical protein CERZMDRAFT_81412 [Cercospora zeae-maydis SCOH1-5]